MSALVNPFTAYRLTVGWKEGSHRNNPAIDYATPIGYPFTAPADGIYRHRPSNLSRADTSAGGHIGELEITSGPFKGRRIRFCHLQRHIAKHGAKVNAGTTIIAATGNTGYVRPRPTDAQPHLGAHVHTYGLTPAGDRWDWTADVAAPTGGTAKPAPSTTPAPTRKRETTMLLVKNTAKTKPQQYMIFGESGAVQIFTGDAAAAAIGQQLGGPAAPVGQSFFDNQVKRAGGITRVEIVDAE